MPEKSKTYEKSPPRVYIRTFGCQMNDADSEVMGRLLEREGYGKVDFPEGADVIILNTCSVRQHAEDRALSYLASLKRVRKENPSTVFVLAGCVAQRLKSKIFEKTPFVNIVLGTDNILELPKLIEEAFQKPNEKVLATEVKGDLPKLAEGFWSSLSYGCAKNSELMGQVTIMRGCDNFCSYCIVPYVRGREKSKPVSDIVSEVEQKVADGCKEIMLLGQNVNSYRSNSSDFADLLREVEKVNGLERIRFMTSHPKDVSEKLINTIRDSSKICEHLHLPAQSGSNRILEGMNRGYTRQQYLELIDKIKREIPKISVTTDLMVGFPGEKKEDFEDTLRLVEDVEFDAAFTFKYSARPGTQAAKEKDDVPLETKKERLAELNELCEKMVLEKNRRLLGKVEEVMVERFARKEKKLVGRTRGNKRVFFSGDGKDIGELLPVEIEKAYTWSLLGRVR
ncbi:MAG: tRNA (N6-isopentenyl adenosine(37)-C2)-methylthiotransferase MiaB [Clostridia bacterium]|nr:tRNA (N6-isopentenyl adenosine(37)-C2)-methylthiotransferase MiaB [Clostridia bacterium]